MKTNRRTLTIGCLIGIVVILAPIIGGVIYVLRQPNPLVQAQARVAPLLVTLSRPLNNTHYPVNSAIPISAQITGAEDAATIEFWVDGALMEVQSPPPDQQRYTAQWHWTPAAEGPHVLLVRAISRDGLISNSNLVQITATPAVHPSIQIQAAAGDTLAGLAERYGVSPEEIRPAGWVEPGQDLPPDSTPGEALPTDPAAPLQPGQPVLVPVQLNLSPSPPRYVPAAPSSGAARAVEAIDPGTLGVNPVDLLGASGGLPAAPELAVFLQDCRAHLRIFDRADGEKGFIVYRGLPGAAGLERIAVLGANDGDLPLEWTEPVLSGTYTYSVAAFNLNGESPSNPAVLNVEDPACLFDSQLTLSEKTESGLRVENGVLILPQEVSIAYLYVSLNRGPWHRMPEEPSAFFHPGDNTLDFNHMVEVLQGDAKDKWNRGVEVDLEVWGWAVGSLVYLGALHHQIPPPTFLRMCSHVGFCTEGLGWDADNQVRLPIDQLDDFWHFEYFAGDLTGKVPVWQVSSMPFPPGPELVAGVPTGSGDIGSSEFTIDMPSISQQAMAGASFGEPPENQDSFQTLLSLMNAPAPLSLGAKYYVRVIPMIGNQVVGEPSNTIEVIIDPPVDPNNANWYKPEAPEMIYSVEIVEFSPVHYPEEGICPHAIVLDSDLPVITNPISGEVEIVPAGTVICPEPYLGEGEPAWYESLFDFVVGALGWISETWENIKQAVVDAVGAIACGGNETCKDLLMVGLNMGLAALGIPPTIPNFDQLLEEGITALAGEVAGYLTNSPAVAELIKEAEALGITDESEVQNWIRDRIADGLQAAVDEMREGGSTIPCMSEEEAHAQGFEPVCLPEGVKAHWDPRAQRLPAYIEVEITRSSTTGLDLTREELANYQLSITADATGHPKWVGESFVEVNGKRWTITEPLEGRVFLTGLHVPYMAPGETVTLKLPLEPTEYWIPAHKEVLDGWSYMTCYNGDCFNPVVNDWQKLYYKANLSITALIAVCPAVQVDYYFDSEVCNTVVDKCEAGPMPYRGEPYQTFCK